MPGHRRRSSRGTRRRSRPPRSGARPCRARQIDVVPRRGRRRGARLARARSPRAARPAAGRAAAAPSRLAGGAASGASCARGSWPSAPSRAGRRSRRACARRAPAVSRSRASPSSSSQPDVADRRERAKQVVHRAAPLQAADAERARAARRRSPDAAPSTASASASSPCSTMSPGLEEDPLRDLAPARRAPQQELEVHAEVLELLALRVAHDRDAPRGRSRPRGAAGTSRSPRPPR